MRDATEKQKGFTLGELLIVTAIIAILVAIAVPTFSYQLEKAREAVDISNLRHAREAGVAYFMGKTLENETERRYYNPDTADLVEWTDWTAVDALPRYGKGTSVKGLGLWTEHGLKYNDKLDVRDCLIMVTADRDGNVFCGWVNPKWTIRIDLFDILATQEEDGKRALYATRSASQNKSTTLAAKDLLKMDTDLAYILNEHPQPANVDAIYCTLEMYYNLVDMAKEHPFSSVFTVKEIMQLNLVYDIYWRYVVPENNRAKEDFFQNTSFKKLTCNAEAVTLATQFWAKIAECKGTDVDAFTSATSKTNIPEINPNFKEEVEKDP